VAKRRNLSPCMESNLGPHYTECSRYVTTTTTTTTAAAAAAAAAT